MKKYHEDSSHLQDEYTARLTQVLRSSKFSELTLAEKGYAHSEEANEFIFKEPLAFVLGLVFDQSIQSPLAWEAPLLLRGRLGHFDVRRIARMEEAHLGAVIAQKKALHRYPKTIARYVIATCQTLISEFSGEVVSVWRGPETYVGVKKNFLRLKGIGEKKANLAVLMLVRDFRVKLEGIEALPLSIDVHLERVLGRSGFFDLKSQEGVRRLHESLKSHHSEFPALLGTALWWIGRNYCHVASPKCHSCPLAPYCQKKGCP